MDFNRRILPFYMTASNDILMARDDTAVQDLEYFQTTEGNTDPMKFRKVLWDGEYPTV